MKVLVNFFSSLAVSAKVLSAFYFFGIFVSSLFLIDKLGCCLNIPSFCVLKKSTTFDDFSVLLHQPSLPVTRTVYRILMPNRISFYLTSEFMNFQFIDALELLPKFLVDSFLVINMPVTKILLWSSYSNYRCFWFFSRSKLLHVD